MPETLVFGSLFAGVGGMDLGLERAGLKCAWQVEIDEYCRRVLAKHWPDVRRWDDVRTFPPSDRTERWGVDVICGGPPCQRTSVAAAIQGKRSGETLWPEMFRVVESISPRWVIVEQPPTSRAWIEKVENDLASAGYHPSRLQLSAERFGAPHRRRRMFIVANSLRERCEALARFAGSSAATAVAWPAPPRGTWREAGSGDRRMDDGFSDWVDRLRGLGNAVVPQVAEWIGRRILAAHVKGAGAMVADLFRTLNEYRDIYDAEHPRNT